MKARPKLRSVAASVSDQRPSVEHTEPLIGEQAEASLPDRIGSHQINGVIGSGAMGIVYDALDRDGRSAMAIKVLRGISPDATYRFKREFRALSTIEHPNVVSLYELAQDEERIYFTMERIDGCDVIEHLCGPLPGTPSAGRSRCRDYSAIRTVFRQLVEGIHAIHKAGFLHRDIKPSNVLVTPRGRAVLLDFGLVRDLQLDRAVGVTAEGAVLGTPLYMSPEQAAGEPAVPASDWYSLGEVLYEALTGRAPYAGLGMMGLLSAKGEPPASPRSVVPGVPDDLDHLCRDLLQSDPERRPDAAEIMGRLGASTGSGPSEQPSRFIGRDAEIGRLREAWNNTRQSGRPLVYVVEGPSGIGKTALVQRFLQQIIESENAVVLSGRCSERESIPYKALDSIMDHLSAFLRGLRDSADVRGLLPRNIHDLVRLFPVLQSVPDVALAPRGRQALVDPIELKRRGVGGLRELLERLCRYRNVVVHIDDLQWSDIDSLRLLDGVLRHREAPGLLVVATARQLEEVSHPELRAFAQRFEAAAEVDLRRTSLGPMSTEESRRLALGLLGNADEPADKLARHVAREAEGSPFFVAELVRYATDPETSQLTGDTFTQLDDVILARIDRLPADARSLLEVLAVAGGRLPGSTALQAGTKAPIGSRARARLRSEHLVRGGSSEQDVLEIYHDRIRVAAAENIERDRLPRIHLDIAKALASSGNADEVALSHHYRQAGEDQAACLHTLAAADRAAQALAFERAAELYAAALDLTVLRDEERAEVEAKLGDALANSGNLHRSARAYLRAAGAVEGSRHIEWKRRAAEHFLTSGHTEEGLAVLREVLPLVGLALPGLKTAAIADLLKQRAFLSVRSRKYRLRRVEEITPAALRQLDVCWTTSRGLIYTDGLLGAEFHARHLRLALRCGEPTRISRALGAEAHLTAGMAPLAKRAEIEKLLEDAAELAETAKDNSARGMVAQARGHAALFRGDFREAAAELDQAVTTFRTKTTGTAQEVAYCRAHGAICLQYMGAVRQLRPRARALLTEARGRDNLYVEGFARGILGHIALLSVDEVDEAEHHLQTYRREAPHRFQAHRLNYVCQSSALERYRGRPGVAWTQAERDYEAVAKSELLRSPFARAEFLLWYAASALAVAAEVPRERPDLIRRARKQADALLRMRVRYTKAYGHLTLAGCDALDGQDELAAAHLRRAIVAFEHHEMRSFGAAATARLADLVGGTEGEDLRSDANEYFETEQMARPDRIIAMVAPGFPAR